MCARQWVIGGAHAGCTSNRPAILNSPAGATYITFCLSVLGKRMSEKDKEIACVLAKLQL